MGLKLKECVSVYNGSVDILMYFNYLKIELFDMQDFSNASVNFHLSDPISILNFPIDENLGNKKK